MTAPTPDAMPGAKYSNAAAAQIMTERYFHQGAMGGVARRMNVNKGTLIGMAHRYAEKLKPLLDLMTILHTAKCRGWGPAGFLEKALTLLTSDPNADLIPLLFPPERKLEKSAFFSP